MKSITQQFISLSIFLAVMFAASAAFAQESITAEIDATTTPESLEAEASVQINNNDRQEMREAIQNEVQERRAAIEETVSERRATLSDQMQTRIINLAANLSNRFDAVVNRLDNIAGRIESRLLKLSAEGTDTSAAESSLAEAVAAIDAARNELATIDITITTVVTSENPGENWRAARLTYLTIKEHVITARQALGDAISAIKAAQEAEITTTIEGEVEVEAE